MVDLESPLANGRTEDLRREARVWYLKRRLRNLKGRFTTR